VGVDHRADAGSHAAADVADLVERRVLADFRHRDLWQHGEIRESRAAHVVVDLLAADGEAGWVARIAVHRLVLRDRHDGHCRHSGVYSGMTWWPFFNEVTPGPTSTTTPAPSWPRIAGNSPSGSAPESVNSSVWQTPVALSSTISSPAFGPSSCTVAISSGLPAAVATAARTSMGVLLIAKRGGSLRQSCHGGDNHREDMLCDSNFFASRRRPRGEGGGG